MEDPSLSNPDFRKDFILYTFTPDPSLVLLLKQKDYDHYEWHLSFVTTILQGAKINYLNIRKEAYKVYKAMKHFILYILKNRVRVMVPHPAIRFLFMQQ